MRKRPNVILFILDSLRWDHLSCYGYPKLTTPCLDEVAQEGWLFKNAISPSMNTAPVHASLLTGLYYKDHKVSNFEGFLSSSIPTLPEILKRYSYLTGGFSANPFVGGFKGLNRGFDVFFEWRNFRSVYSSNLWIRAFNKCLQGVKLPHLQIGKRLPAHRIVDRIIEWIQEVTLEGSPFFVLANLMETHLPHNPPLPLRRRLFNSSFPPSKFKEEKKFFEARIKHMVGVEKFQEEDWEILKELLDMEIAYVDRELRRMISFLKKYKLWDKTIFILCSDHGDNYGEHDLISHVFCLYDTLIKVPLILRFPEVFEGGKEISTQVQLHDLFPTILKLCGVPDESFPSYIHRPSFLELEDERFTFAFSEMPDQREENLIKKILEYDPTFAIKELGTPATCIRTLQYKYIKYQSGKEEFYDLEKDPEETQDLSKQKIPEKIHLKERLQNWLKEKSPFPQTSYKPAPSPKEEELKRKLQALGYF